VFVCSVILLGGKGVRVNTPFINAFQKKKDFLNVDSAEDMEVANTYLSEFFNILVVSGMPSHKLMFKIGTPMMLLHNLDPLVGQCNGTRLIVRCFTMRVVEAEIITCKGADNVAFIPHIKFISDNIGLPFTFARKQFPWWLAYAMTINKSQGQTLFHVGLHLVDDVFFAWPTLGCLFMHQGTSECQSSAARHCAWPDWPYAQCCV
jgi:ATP-dependent DNA helicase PIF1